MPVVLPSPSPVSSAYVSSLVQEVYRHLDATSFGVINRLTDNIATVEETTFTFDFEAGKAIRPGAYLCVDLEVVYVWTYNEATRVATVQRAMQGSTAAPHAAGALVQVQPRVSQFDVLTQIVHDIDSWPPSLYQTATTTISGGVTTRAYDLPGTTGITRILEIRRSRTGTSPTLVRKWRLDLNADTTTFPSGRSIVFPNGWDTGDTIEIVYAKPFDTSAVTLTTSLATIGLTDSMKDIPVYGAAARLVREAPRTETQPQGQARLADEVPPGHLGNTSAALWKKRDDRIHQEIARLRELYPQRRA